MTVETYGPTRLRPRERRPQVRRVQRDRDRCGRGHRTTCGGGWAAGVIFDARRDRLLDASGVAGSVDVVGADRATGGGARVGLAVRVADGVAQPVEPALGERRAQLAA